MARLLFVTLFFSVPVAFAAVQPTIKCQVDKTVAGSQKKLVPVTVVKGMEFKKRVEIQFEGQTFSTVWNQGDKFEKQTHLTMRFGDLESSIYDFDPRDHKGPINILSRGELRFQCWAE